jgi:ubiquinol-cytochrome c reductase cytochrome b subunit
MAIIEKTGTPASPTEPEDAADGRMWTNRLRNKFFGTYPPEKLLPDRQPSYVASWIYVFGVASIAALIVLIVSGLVLTLEGPAWYHVSSTGHFVNSVHFWAVQLFMIAMVVHLWGKFWMAAWRGRRAMTWVTGAIAFFASIGTAFTGFLVQSNFESQWIAFEAKDGLNAVGVGAWFNVANAGQMLLLHVCLLPLVVGLLVVWHVLLVRKHGVVPPIPLKHDTADELAPAAEAKS